MAHNEDFFSNFEHEIDYAPLNLQHDFLFNSDHELDSTKPSNIPSYIKQFEMMKFEY